MLRRVMHRRTGAGGRPQAGTSMIEVLVSIVIVVVGLLGLAGLQSHATLAELESYQRAQAILLVQDMVDRINANRFAAQSYSTGITHGTGQPVGACAAMATIHERDLCEWNNALLGAAEVSGGGTKVGAMIDARGCVQMTNATMPRQFLVSVVWQGLNSTAAPPSPCGLGLYGAETTRRAISTTITIGCLQNNPASGLCVFPP